jgi:dTDP-4-amino-4,6-dideoxygalactose transaminase
LRKSTISDLAVFGGPVAFERVRSTSNLVRPDFERFLSYSKVFIDAKRYTNDGPLNKMLEGRLAEFHEVDRCVTFSNGFWGLVLAISALALPDRSEVIMPSITYRRLADAVAWTRLIPRFCDIDADTLAINPDTVLPLINERTALLLAVHPIVNCCDALGLESLSKSTSIPLLIDSVESAYEVCAGRRVGSFGNCELFSMHASKLLNGFEGGYVTTNDHDLADQLALQRGFGFRAQDETVCFGVNAKLNEIHAAMALTSLDEVGDQVEMNRRRYDRYRAELDKIPGICLREFLLSERPGFKNIVVELEDRWPLTRTDTLTILNADGALARAYYSPPLHTKRTLYPTIAGPLPVTDAYAERLIVLPSGYQVNEDDIGMVASMLSLIASFGNSIEERLRADGSHVIRR